MDYSDICDKKKQKVPASWQVLNTPIGLSCIYRVHVRKKKKTRSLFVENVEQSITHCAMKKFPTGQATFNRLFYLSRYIFVNLYNSQSIVSIQRPTLAPRSGED